MKKILLFLIIIIPVHLAAQDTLVVVYKGDTLKISKAGVIMQDTVFSETQVKDKSIVENLKAPDVENFISFNKIFWAIIFLIIGYLIIRFITRSIQIWSEKKAERRVRGKAILPIVKISGWFILVYFIISVVFHPSYDSLFAFTASIGVAIGFAAQDILKNIFGGFVILIDRPFKVGDKIEVNGVYGEVLDMSLRSTRIVTADDSVVSLPNGDLMNQAISNSNSGELNCQVVAEIYLPITIDTVEVKRIAIESAKVSKFIYLAKPINVLFFNELQHDKLCFKMRLKAYVMDIRYEFAFKSEMNEIVIRELLKAGILKEEMSI